MKKRTIGVLGGSYDPPHLGHLLIANKIKEVVDEVWITPCGHRPDKPMLGTYNSRLEMCKLAFSEFIVSDYEQDKPMIPTYLLLTELSEAYPEKKFYFVMGMDLLETLHTWNYFDQLVNEVNFLVLNRGGYIISQRVQDEFLSRENFQIVQTNFLIELSSTQIRNESGQVLRSDEETNEKIRKVNCIIGIDSISNYIVLNNLYQRHGLMNQS